MAADIQRSAFFSYSRINKEFATKLAKGLRSAGYPIWFDLFDIPTGARWDDEVEKALHECSIFMIILTPASIASENVKDEIGYAIDHGKRILPILMEQCEVPLRLRRFQYVDFTAKSFEEGFESAKELLASLIDEGSVIGIPTETKPLPTKPTGASLTATTPKNLRSTGLVIGVVGIIMIVVLVIGGVGFSFLSNRPTPATEMAVIFNPATETSVAVISPTETQNAIPPTSVDNSNAQLSVPTISNFQACAEPCNGQNSSTTFESGVKVIYLQFDYQNISPGSQYTRSWTNNGQEWIKYSCAWDGPTNGTETLKLTEPGGMRYGIWEVTIWVDNVVLFNENITLSGNWSYWDPVLNTINKCRGT
jgi:hypothetical protein